MTVNTTQENIIELIQQDILDLDIWLETVLFKAKILAHQLKNKKLQEWVKYEIEGYPNVQIIPDYRIISTQCFGTFSNGSDLWKNVSIPLYKMPQNFINSATKVKLNSGITLIEELAEQDTYINFKWKAEQIQLWMIENPKYCECMEVNQPVTASTFSQISTSVRSRLQDFILELSDLPWEMSRKDRLVRNEVERLVSVIIYNNPQRGNVTTFDQRNQQVTNQNNAARDIYVQGDTNISSIDNIDDLISEVRKLKKDLEQQASNNIVDAEIVDDVDLELANTIQELKKENPDRNKIIEYFQKVKNLLANVADAAKYGKIILELIEVAKNIF